MHRRRKARERALQVLCSMDRPSDRPGDRNQEGPISDPEMALSLFDDHFLGGELLKVALLDEGDGPEVEDGEARDSEAQRRYAESLVHGVRRDLEAIDELITRSSRNWRLLRMAWVDRNLLRLAAYELRSCPDVPPKVVVNEAIELAKRYGTSDSSSFINGVLDRLMTEVQRS